MLSACAGLPSNQIAAPPYNYNSNQRHIVNLQQWQFDGKLGLRSADDAISATINWRQIQDHFEIHLSGPLGQGRTRLYGDHNRIYLQTSRDETLQAATAEELMDHALGWQLPVSDLQYWVLGLPSPSSPAEELVFNEQGILTSIIQQGWTIQYSRFQPVQNLYLPERLTMTQNEIKLTLIMKQWQLSP